MDGMEIHVGDTFNSYEELNSKIRQYEESKYVSLYMRDNKLLATAIRKGIIKKQVNDNLKYLYVTFSCYHGGRNFKSHSKGLRPNQR